MIETVRTKYQGTSEEEFYDDVAKNVAGLAYVGKCSDVNQVLTFTHPHLLDGRTAGGDTVR